MSEQNPNVTKSMRETVSSFADFCVYDAWRSSDEKKDKSFVGIKIEDNRPKIYFPMGYRASKPSEDVCKWDFYQLIAVLNDKSLQSYFSEEDLKKSQLDFPFYAYLSVLQYYLDFGYFVESETIYKKGFSGKINWPRTIKRIKPQVVKDEEGHDQVVYLNLITRKTSYREDNLITLVHKFCVKEAAQLIGPLYGISEDEVEEPELLFDYELFAEVIQDKIAATFNDKHLELFHAMLKMVRYLGNKENRGEDGSENEPLFGVNTFAPVWEAMVDKIFGKLPQGVAKDKFNPHLRWNDGCRDEKLDESEEEIVLNDPKRSTLRPDTIMVMGEGVCILDSKYYKYGLTGFNSHLPGAESVCKQMAYAEYVEKMLGDPSTSLHFAQDDTLSIYNAFVMPYCADAEGASASSATFQMKRVGYIYGDWKNVEDENRPYHKIHCILLDMKSVMRNYANNPAAQSELAKLIPH
ncbi:LlaJI restriction endonuclease [Fibrobacter sp. UWR3]|uniref:LlaJI family restriction endonuclease n=1 Tax=Fibrobacter sp. UWR3 TaxID=1896217 RepID=UPI00091436AE|nr:LlaJI family restriction endonuclease [Fibrobacter sp. UWR3]MBR6125780.1 LlaJI family restriction endonuclease [Candidatus Saccharibacteria bacterium]SHM49621.1 LlaJI restriction endonuclease [Fibrobacter sp. UWR3]